MKFILKKNSDEVARVAADLVIEALQAHPDMTMILPTGGTPVELYKKLIEAFQEGKISFKDVTTYNLDNYLDIPDDDENNYEVFMKENLFNHIDLPTDSWRVPPSNPENAEAFCREYEKALEEAEPDLCLLGIGENGHIAFNEPTPIINPYTQVVDLTEDTIKVNSRFFKSVEEVPTKAVTMGIGSIMRAKKIILLATGEKKKDAMERLYQEEKVDPMFPVSFLFLHPDVTIITDSIEG